jgi:hypothetical protein
MKSTKKLKAGQLKLPVTHTWTKAAMDAANLPEADNPFVTRDELSNVNILLRTLLITITI